MIERILPKVEVMAETKYVYQTPKVDNDAVKLLQFSDVVTVLNTQKLGDVTWYQIGEGRWITSDKTRPVE